MNPTTQTIINNTSRKISIMLIVLAIGSLITALLLLLSYQKTKEITSINQELDSITKSSHDTQELRQYAVTRLSEIKSINSFFPNQETIVAVISQLESMVKQFDPQATVSVVDKQPITTNDGPAIHFNIRMKTSYLRFQELLIEFEKVPLIIQVISFDLDNPRQEDGQAQINIRVYVDQNFTQPS